MQWHRLPPLGPEDCCFRGPAERDGGEEFARCGLVGAALPEADPRSCRASRSVCAACCRAAPATPDSWNPVVSSLVYHAASALLKDPAARPEVVARSQAARARALRTLDVVGPRPVPKQPSAASVRLGELIPPPATRHAKPVCKWAVGVTTSPRPRPTLDACLAHLSRAGWPSPHLFMDSAVRVSERFGRLPGTLRSPAAGAWPNHYLSLFELTVRHPDADAFLIVQDDALVYDGENVRDYLERTLWPGRRLPLVSLFCPAPYTAPHSGWSRFRKAWVWGAVAWVFPREIVQLYLRDRFICRHRWRSGTEGLAGIDVLIGRWARRRGIPVWFPTPSLVQHIGETSTLWADCPAAGPRVASLFVGDQQSPQVG